MRIYGEVLVLAKLFTDCLYRSLPFHNKLRMHFHPFMRLVHKELNTHQGKKDPLKFIARDFASKYILLVFDEFVVSDIADAMILGVYSDCYFHMVCVWSQHPMPCADDLYKRGLQRKLFLPTIALLKHNTDVIHLPTSMDYRANYLSQTGVFLYA